jgi:hypothetical protein
MNLNNFQFFTLGYGGDTFYDSNGYRIHTFKNSGIFTVTNPGLIDVLVVGGGAGGGVNVGGGGGGVLYQSNIPVQNGQINIVVGLGGLAYPDTTNGTQSSFSNILVASGGFVGTDQYQGGNSGTPQNITGNVVNYPYGGGGGGASGIITINNNGINGLSNVISGDIQYYGGGGGGSGSNLGYDGIGGLGGGGNGSFKTQDSTINAIANTGGGGGACGKSLYTGGRGGSGIVILRYTVPETKVFLLENSNISTKSILSNIPVPTKLIATSTAIVTTQTINGLSYQMHTFITTGTFTVASQSSIGYIDILVVGGGGGGSSYGLIGLAPGNGGGGGQVLYKQQLLINAAITSTTYTVTVGSGGQPNHNGISSSFGNYITCTGGIAGSSNMGGKSGINNYGGNYFVDYINGDMVFRGSGGGGANMLGISSSYTNAGLGGDGKPIDITGTTVFYGTGGGGGGLRSTVNSWQTIGANAGNTNINNGAGGGLNTISQSANANTGSGGGGAGQGIGAGDIGGSGGSGIVIIRYLL